jgi:hypothetical protein
LNTADGDADYPVLDSKLCNAPIQVGQPEAKDLFADWYSTVEYLSSYISPERLALSIVCDVHPDDVEAAMRAIKPVGLLPALRNCNTRLSRKFNLSPTRLQRIQFSKRDAFPSHPSQQASQAQQD